MKKHRIEYYLKVAEAVASASPCARKNFGAILVKNEEIISTGYNGSVRGALNCGKDTPCGKDANNEEHYTSYTHCSSIHAEHNACLHAGRRLATGSTMFLAKKSGDGMSGPPCRGCRRVMINVGVYDIYYMGIDGELKHDMVEDWIELENEMIRKNAQPERSIFSFGDKELLPWNTGQTNLFDFSFTDYTGDTTLSTEEE